MHNDYNYEKARKDYEDDFNFCDNCGCALNEDEIKESGFLRYELPKCDDCMSKDILRLEHKIDLMLEK